jgi:hypothetical protein
MIATITALWPVIKWALQALGLMSTEDRELERTYKLKLLEAAERKDAAMIEAFADFQKLWRPPAERVYVWANTAIALFQPTIIALIYWDVFLGTRKSVTAANELGSTIGGLFIMSIMLFPFYGPALVSGVGAAFSKAVEVALEKKNGKRATVKPGDKPGSESELERLARLNRERNDEIIERIKPDDEHGGPRDL